MPESELPPVPEDDDLNATVIEVTTDVEVLLDGSSVIDVFAVNSARRKRVEVSERKLTESDRKLFRKAKELEVQSWLDQESHACEMFHNEVAFSVNHQLLVNLLEFELVVSVVVVAVVLDLVSTLDAHVLVLVLVHRASSVVLVLGEIVIVVDPLRDRCFNGCDEDCGGTCCFCVGDSVGGCCCVRSCCLGTPCLERSSGSSPSASDAIRSCSFASVSSSDSV